jgi:hypothetical protein
MRLSIKSLSLEVTLFCMLRLICVAQRGCGQRLSSDTAILSRKNGNLNLTCMSNSIGPVGTSCRSVTFQWRVRQHSPNFLMKLERNACFGAAFGRPSRTHWKWHPRLTRKLSKAFKSHRIGIGHHVTDAKEGDPAFVGPLPSVKAGDRYNSPMTSASGQSETLKHVSASGSFRRKRLWYPRRHEHTTPDPRPPTR